MSLPNSREAFLNQYYDEYMILCNQKRVPALLPVRKMVEESIASRSTPDKFILNGNSQDTKHRIDDDGIECLFLPMIGISFLKEIDLSYNEFGDKGAKILARLITEDKYLEICNLNSNSIKEAGAEALCKALQLNERIHTFNLSNNPIGDIGGMEIARMLQINNNLVNLRISGTELKATSLIAIWTAFKNNDTLTSLDISNNISNLNNLTQSVINDVMLHLSRTISQQFTLKHLNLSRFGITDWSTTDYFANALRTCYNLETLDLTANKISRDGGVAIFNALASHSNISSLILSKCSIQDEGAFAANEFLIKNSSLKRLYLDYNKITSKGLMEIALALNRNYSLEYIALWGNLWDKLACEVRLFPLKKAFSPLIGGPIYSVSIGDDLLLPALPRNNKLFEFENTDPDSVLARKRKGKSRLRRNGADVAFYTVEGILHVAESQ